MFFYLPIILLFVGDIKLSGVALLARFDSLSGIRLLGVVLTRDCPLYGICAIVLVRTVCELASSLSIFPGRRRPSTCRPGPPPSPAAACTPQLAGLPTAAVAAAVSRHSLVG
jgi:hypothetical protein